MITLASKKYNHCLPLKISPQLYVPLCPKRAVICPLYIDMFNPFTAALSPKLLRKLTISILSPFKLCFFNISLTGSTTGASSFTTSSELDSFSLIAAYVLLCTKLFQYDEVNGKYHTSVACPYSGVTDLFKYHVTKNQNKEQYNWHIKICRNFVSVS